MLRVGMHRHAGLEVVGEAGSVETALTVAGRTSPQAVVLDLQLPDAEPHEAFTAIQERLPEARVAIYSARESNRHWYEERGARFFGKASDRIDDIIDWLRSGGGPRP